MTEPHNITHFYDAAIVGPVSRLVETTTTIPISISAYNEVVTLYMQRGDVLRNVLHYLTARREVTGLNPAEVALLGEVEMALGERNE